MRTFEIPAMSGCMLAENTEEHREIFGEDGSSVLYFQDIGEMLEKTRWLLDHPEERRRLAEAAHRLITRGRHTYGDRLLQMLRS
jgi:spore maturation protein CgeB